MKSTKSLTILKIVSLALLFSANTFSLHNSFQMFHYQYNRNPTFRSDIEIKFEELTNGYLSSTYWFFMNLKVGCTLLSELLLFLVIAFKVSNCKSPKYYSLTILIFSLQLLVTLQILWPFLPSSSYGQYFKVNQQIAKQQCTEGIINSQYVCQFINSLLYNIEMSKILVILIIFSLSGISASHLIKSNNKQSNLFEIVPEQIVKKEKATERDELEYKITDFLNNNFFSKRINSLTTPILSESFSQESQKPAQIQQSSITIEQKDQLSVLDAFMHTEQQVQEAKKINKIRRPSFWSSTSTQQTQEPSPQSSFEEDSQSDSEQSWQPSYITFVPKKKQEKKRDTNQRVPQISCNSSFSTIGESSSRNVSIGYFGNILDKSIDQYIVDIEENKQL